MFVRSGHRSIQLFCLLIAALLIPVAPAPAQTSVLESSSASFLPADGAFYASLLRNREQVDAFLKSNAYQHIKGIPFVKEIWEDLGVDEQLQNLELMKQDPQAAAVINLVLDSLSHEIFFYGGNGFAELGETMANFSLTLNTSQLQAMMQGQDPTEAQLKALLDGIKNLPPGAKMPEMIIGFKSTDAQSLRQGLDQLEGLSALAAQQLPMLQGRINRKPIGKGDYLIAELDGSLIPWDMLRQELPISDADFRGIKNRLEKLTVTTGIGVFEDHLLLFIGSDLNVLEKLGTGPSLAKRSEFAKLKTDASKRITSIAFVNGDYLNTIANPQQQTEQLAQMLQGLLANAPIGNDLKKEIATDLEAFLKTANQNLPKLGSQLAYSYLEDTGYSSITYNWGSTNLDASKPLDVLHHVGGNPLAVFAARMKHDPADYDNFSKLLGRLAHYADRVAEEYLEDEEMELYTDVKTAFMPLFKRLDNANRSYLNPAFGGMSSAFVLDAKTTSRSWQAFLPPAERPLPMIEFGTVTRVNEADKVRKGTAEYFDVTQGILDQLFKLSVGKHAELFPIPIPKLEIPAPKTRDTAGGTIYSYSLPPEAGLDEKLAPNAGLNDRVAVLSLVPDFTARLMNAASPKGDMADFASKNAGQVYYLNFEGFIDALMPWIDYGAIFMGQVNVGTENNVQPANLILQVKQVAKVLKCFKTVSGVTTFEDGIWVTRGKATIIDLPN